jgi:hypothetical protein
MLRRELQSLGGYIAPLVSRCNFPCWVSGFPTGIHTLTDKQFPKTGTTTPTVMKALQAPIRNMILNDPREGSESVRNSYPLDARSLLDARLHKSYHISS